MKSKHCWIVFGSIALNCSIIDGMLLTMADSRAVDRAALLHQETRSKLGLG